MKALVVYYSRTGKTKRVAEAIAKNLGADLEEIRDTKSRRGLFGFLRSGREGMREVPGKIEQPKLDPSRYDLVVLGAPVWGSALASPLRGYLVGRAKTLPQKVAFFCTQGGEDPGRTFAQLETLCGRKPVATLSLRSEHTSGDALTQAVNRFVGDVSRS
jgi:flavodoxin